MQDFSAKICRIWLYYIVLNRKILPKILPKVLQRCGSYPHLLALNRIFEAYGINKSSRVTSA